MKGSENPRAFLLLLAVLGMLGPLTLNIPMPSLPSLPKALDTTKEAAQLTFSLFLFGMALSQLALGPLADRYGRRPVLLVSLTTYVLSSLAATLAPNIGVLIVARIFQSAGATAGLTLGRTMIRDRHSQDHAASMIGYVTMAVVIAPMIAPSLGAFIDEAFGWRAILLFCTLFGLGSLLLALPYLPETRPAGLVAASMTEVFRRSMRLVRTPRYMAYWGATAFASAQFYCFLGTSPHLMIDLVGTSKAEFGLWFISLSGGYMIGNFISGRFAQKLGIDTLIFWGNVFGLLGGVTILVPALFGILTPLTLFVPAFLLSIGNGLVLPNAIAGGIGVDPSAAGAGSGLMGFGQIGVGAVLSFFSAKWSVDSALPLAFLILFSAILAQASGWLSRNL